MPDPHYTREQFEAGEMAAEDAQRALASANALVFRAVSHLGVVASRRAPRWWHAKQLFGHGQTVSAEICAAVGFDPDAEIGPSEWERLESLVCSEDEELTEEGWEEVMDCDPPPEDER